MILLYIENKELSNKIEQYLDYMNIKYTTNLNSKVDYAIIAEINKKTCHIINTKKTIFIAYLEEKKIYQHFLKKTNSAYQNKILNTFHQCSKVVVSMPYFKNLISLNNLVYIPKEVIKLDFIKKKKGKNIVFYDPEYQCLEEIYSLAIKYPKQKFYYVGNKKLSLKERTLFNKLPNNIMKIKSWTLLSYINLVREAFLVIHTDYNLDYINIPILLEKNVILKELPYFEDYFIPNKDCYFYHNTKSLLLKFDKIIDKRLSNLSSETSQKLIKLDCKYIAIKYSILLI